MCKWLRDILLCIPLLWVALPTAAASDYAARDLDRLAAPIALYPDALLTQILMASTYPDEVADAARWSRAHPGLSGDDAVAAVADEDWEPSVQSLVAFPQVLATLDANPGWLAELGDAFLARPEALMERIQYLRRQAHDSGRLTSNARQHVTVVEEPLLEPDVQHMTYTRRVIVIESAYPDVIYVPDYDPRVVFAPWGWPAYPPVHFVRPPGYAVSLNFIDGIGFGLGIVVGNALWGYPDWRHRHLGIDLRRYRHFHRPSHFDPRHPRQRWQHAPSHRRPPGHGVRDRFERRPPAALPPQFRAQPAPAPVFEHRHGRDNPPARRVDTGPGAHGDARIERREWHERGTAERRPWNAGNDGYERRRPPAAAPGQPAGARIIATPEAAPAPDWRPPRNVPDAGPGAWRTERDPARGWQQERRESSRFDRPRSERAAPGEPVFREPRMRGEGGGRGRGEGAPRHERGGFESRHGGRGER